MRHIPENFIKYTCNTCYLICLFSYRLKHWDFSASDSPTIGRGSAYIAMHTHCYSPPRSFLVIRPLTYIPFSRQIM